MVRRALAIGLLCLLASVLPFGEAHCAVLTHGPVVGGVTWNSASVFVRTDAPASVRVSYSTSPSGPWVDGDAVVTDGEKDYAAIIGVAGLSAETFYYLDIKVDGVSQHLSPSPRFKTFPVEASPGPFKFVILTDFEIVNIGPPYVYTFAAASQESPDFVIIGGDFDHRSTTTLTEKRTMFKELYAPAGPMTDFVMRIVRQYPLAHMWDDHDFGENNADKTYAFKDRSLQVLREFFPAYPMTDRGDWQRFTYGNADFFLLDSRSQRDLARDMDGPGKSMLDGDDLGPIGQLAWLKDGLSQSTARWKFILTPLPFNPSSKPKDAWGAYGYERTVIVNHINQTGITGVVFISGDVHAGGIDSGVNSDFPEMMVPSVNHRDCQTVPNASGEWSEGSYGSKGLRCPGYGLVTVMTDPDRVQLEVKDQFGNTVIDFIVN